MEFSIAINLAEILVTLLALCGVLLAGVILLAIIVGIINVIIDGLKGGKNGWTSTNRFERLQVNQRIWKF